MALLKVYNERGNRPGTLRALHAALEEGQLLILPTDTRYTLCCDALNAKSLEELAHLKGVDPEKSLFSLLCADLSQVSHYARMGDAAFRLMKQYTPGPVTFILPTSNELPRIYRHRKEVGVRLVRHHAVHELLEMLGRPITGFSLPLPPGKDDEAYLYHPELMEEVWGSLVAFIADGGVGDLTLSTVVNCTQEPFEVVREGVETVELD